MTNEWDGRTERRKMNQEDHDLLIEINEGVKHLVEKLNHHIIEDEKTFATLEYKVNKHDKVLWVGMGIVITLQVILKLLK